MRLEPCTRRAAPLVLACSLLAGAALLVPAALPVTVAITFPAHGSPVGGTLALRGTSSGLVNGRVSVSVDGGPFQLASGVANWSFSLNTATLATGPHTITARARETQQEPGVTHTITVEVANGGAGPSVAVTYPADGARLGADTFTMTGTASGAAAVKVSLDGGGLEPASGVASWDFVVEAGRLAPGPHTLSAVAENGAGGRDAHAIGVTIDSLPAGAQTITYISSVDGVSMRAVLWIPAGYTGQEPAPVVGWLHGGGGTGSGMLSYADGALVAELDARGWIGIAPDGREWGLYQQGCSWRTSAAYVNNPDPNVGPGEQDILDAIAWVQAHYNVDPDRVYLTGHSMGGRGTYGIGLRNPDLFAAIAPTAPAIDMYEIFVRRPEPRECKEGMVGGQPGDSPFVDAMYSITSGRFLIENACNLPVFHAHGLNDCIASNTLTCAPFLHGWHITSDTTWSGCHPSAPPLCFGHTPTLSQLRAAFADGYDWAFLFTPADHSPDRRWVQGTAATPDVVGTPDPGNPGRLLGFMDFFAARVRVRDPRTVVYKSYTSEHRRAYWAEIEITAPYLDLPGALRATRRPEENAFSLEVVRVATARFDLTRMGLSVSAAVPLVIEAARLEEPLYDPNLAAPGEALRPRLVLTGGLDSLAAVTVRRDGVPLPDSLVELAAGELRIGPLDIAGPTTLAVLATDGTTAADEPALGGGRGTAPLAVYPSPTPGLVRLVVPGAGEVVVEIIDVSGRLVARLRGHGVLTWDGHGHPAGLYLARVAGNPGCATRIMLIR